MVCCANDGIAAIINQRLGEKRFISFYINTQTTKLREVVATGNGQPNLNTGLIRDIPIPFPPSPEQRAIAAALSDVDALLGGLDRLIAKKRDLKQAAMQQLLTGQTRLPGFHGEWQVKRFDEIAAIRNQKVMPWDVDPESPCVELEHIGQGDGRLVARSTAGHSSSSKYRFFAGDVLFGRLRSYLRKYWVADCAGICTTEIWPLMIAPSQTASGFLHAVVQSDRFIGAASVSYGTHMPRADWGVVRGLEIKCPPIYEQCAIATVLSDMDAELAALEARRAKTRDLKQAMMQELLTGKTRLV
jgi:type I restriction enzyme, S subunit